MIYVWNVYIRKTENLFFKLLLPLSLKFTKSMNLKEKIQDQLVYVTVICLHLETENVFLQTIAAIELSCFTNTFIWFTTSYIGY